MIIISYYDFYSLGLLWQASATALEAAQASCTHAGTHFRVRSSWRLAPAQEENQDLIAQGRRDGKNVPGVNHQVTEEAFPRPQEDSHCDGGEKENLQ